MSKVGSSGRLGPRYGRKIRVQIAKVEGIQRARHKCPSCLKPGLKRDAKGIWSCPKCKVKFTGKAYKPY